MMKRRSIAFALPTGSVPFQAGRRYVIAAVCLPPLLAGRATAATPVGTVPKWHPGHYVFVGETQIRQPHLSRELRGVQRLYTWAELEPVEGRYDLSSIRADLAYLAPYGKRLVLQVQYKAFGHGQRRVPAYIQGPAFGGGVFRTVSGAWDPVLWNPRVGERMDALFRALGRAFDGEYGVEAVVLPETSPGAALHIRPQLGVESYSAPVYVAALKERMSALRRAFPRTVVIQYTNFPPSALPELAAFMRQEGVGLGGPDVYPRQSALSDPQSGVYRLYAPLSGVVPLGAAVQSPNYSVAAKKRGAAFSRGQPRDAVVTTLDEEAPIPVREHLKLAQEKLRLNYLFWSAYPRERFEDVKRLLAEPELASDPAGGLIDEIPARAFLV